MSNPIILPEKTSFYDWASQQSFIRPEFKWTTPPKDEKDWRSWAYYSVFLIQTKYPTVPLPDEKIFQGNKGWKKWAEELVYQIL
jgi:hypothetical protein